MIRSHLGKLAVAGITLGTFATVVVGPASAQSPNAADKVPITEVNQIFCDGSTPPGATTVGFANIRSDGNGPVVAQVSLKDGRPNTTYQFTLVQTPGNDCNPFTNPPAGSITTNGQGNGNERLSVAKRPSTTGAFVISRGQQFLVSGHYVFGSK